MIRYVWIAYFPDADFTIITSDEYHWDLEDLRKSNWIKVMVEETKSEKSAGQSQNSI